VIVRPDGPIPARIMIVGEAPGAEEEARGIPFVGASGAELNKMLGEAGIARSECFVTNVTNIRPFQNDINRFIAKAKKDRTSAHYQLKDKWVTKEIMEGYSQLQAAIQSVRPNIIIALGNVPLWILTGLWGITKWRGSMLYYAGTQTKVIPTIHPASVLREWSQRAIVVSDLRRAARFKNGEAYPKPDWRFIIRPSFETCHRLLAQFYVRCFHGEPVRISFDLETRAGHIACAGISWSLEDAMCIPFMVAAGPEKSYWTADQESEIVWSLKQLLTHPNCHVVGQNLLYDAQYTWKHWFFVPNVKQDTMISQHAIFSDMPKGLGFLGSMYANYFVYWKDEGKDWANNLGEDQLWRYNCLDCVYTDEVATAEMAVVDKLQLGHVHAFQQSMFWPVLQAMQRGVRIDKRRRDELILEVQDAIAKRQQLLRDILGHELNPDSPKQMHTLFYDDLKCPVQMTRAAKGVPARPTLNDDALQKLVKIDPLLKPIVNSISDCRTLGKFLSNFLCRPLSEDGRMRCSYNIGGSASGKSAPKTYRLSSSEDAFGSGTNLQTIPSEKSKSIGKAAARGGIDILGDPYQFPNIREIFIPDPGCVWIDLDLDRADLFVVAYEAEDKQLKEAMNLGVDIHMVNAYVLSNQILPPLEELIEGHPRYVEHRKPIEHQRQFAKVFVHGTDYGGKARTMAIHTGRSIAEVERAQKLWFGTHPGIERWHARVMDQVTKRRFVENKFGYRWYIFDRLDGVASEAIAWGPQSTVSIVINKIWERIYRELPEVNVLMQVHDSLCLQMPAGRVSELLPKLKELAKVIVPYDDPLVIPFSIKMSERSWGHC
jgi:uracil-DNA glycosylase